MSPSHSRRSFLAASGAATATAGLGAAAPSPAQASETLRLPDMPLHDPFIVPDPATRTYYLYTSNVPSMSGISGVGTMVYRSQNLRDWLEPEVVFRPDPKLWATDGAWAPEVHKYRGRYYLFTTLHNHDRKLPIPPPNDYGIPAQLPNYMRGTIVAVSNSLLGPFTALDKSGPTPPSNFMTLDGTLYLDPEGQPWMVYAHEWLQKIDGTIEAIRLDPGLSGTVGDPIYLFKGSDAFWLSEDMPAPSTAQIIPYVTDGPQLYRTTNNALIMLWSTYEKSQDGVTVGGDYVETYAISRSGDIAGPWDQQRPLVRRDSGHGMLFASFEGHASGKLMMILHRPFNDARGKIYEVQYVGSKLRVLRQRTDLDGGG